MPQLAAVGHRVPGIDGKIQEDLFDHARVGLHEGRLLLVIAIQPDVFGNDAPQHFDHVLDQIIHHERLGLHDLLAAEDQQLASQGGSPLGGGEDLL